MLEESIKCLAVTSKGERCKRDALEGSDYCALPAHKSLGDPVVAETDEVEICGHMNVHIDPPLTCELDKGHEGNHVRFSFRQVAYKNDEIVSDQIVDTEWSDIAGTPVDEIKPDLTTLPEATQIAMERLGFKQ